ncbi:MAG: hypothetical protein R3B90_12130 [Planctomycetaceae bacterium]
MLPRDADLEARRPIVPSFERFHATAGGDMSAGGRLLLGELACSKCHMAGDNLSQQLLTKEPPRLSEVGGRRPEWMVRFLTDPHAIAGQHDAGCSGASAGA